MKVARRRIELRHVPSSPLRAADVRHSGSLLMVLRSWGRIRRLIRTALALEHTKTGQPSGRHGASPAGRFVNPMLSQDYNFHRGFQEAAVALQFYVCL